VVERDCPRTKEFLEGLYLRYKQMANLTLPDVRKVVQAILNLGPIAQAS